MLSEQNVESSEKNIQEDLDDHEDETEVNVVAFGKNKFKDTMQLKKEKMKRSEDELEQEE